MPGGRIEGLYYITHIDNVPSMLSRGILCHERVELEGVPFTRIYDEAIVANRRSRLTPEGKSLWSYANLYFQPRNPMLYRVLCEASLDRIVILCVRPDVLNRTDIFIANGNAASHFSDILPAQDARKLIPKIARATRREWWSGEDGSKRTVMAECLVPSVVPPELIQTIYVRSHEGVAELKARIRPHGVPVVPQPNMFFEALRQIPLTESLSLLEGDMFFSRMHTLTISVNCVGVMGKGLASRAKYQFPDGYVVYQDQCRGRGLRMGRPYLYKRETSLDHALADEPSSLSNANQQTWLLFFATKQHWREQADIAGIEEGVRWVQHNCTSEGVRSLAVPALGCGLGRLHWRDVGPLMCRHLSLLDIPVQLYLPAEKKPPEDQLTKDFLLG